MEKYDSRLLLLQLFADGGGEGGTGAGNESSGSETATDGNAQEVVYGTQNMPKEQTEDSPVIEDSKKEGRSKADEFANLIKKDGEYHEEYKKHFNDSMNKRLKSSQAKVDTLDKLQPTLNALYGKYGVEPGDIEQLNKAIEEDESVWEEQAIQHDMTVPQYKKMLELQRRVDESDRKAEEALKEKSAREQIQKWQAEAETVKEVYPEFDLLKEVENPVFRGLINNGFSLINAYQSAHIEELIPAAMNIAAQTAEKKVANRVATNRSRPSENGAVKNASAKVKSDVSSLNDDDLENIYKRARSGEKITFAR